MKKVPILFLFVAVVSCGPSKHAVNVEMRHPSKAGVELSGKTLSVVYLENENAVATDFNESMADGFAYTLEEEYGTGDGSIGIYRMRKAENGNYASKDSLFNILMDTGADLVFLFDEVKFGNLSVGVPAKLSYQTSADSSYLTSGSIPFTVKLYCFDGMDKDEKVQAFGGTAIAAPSYYSNGKDDGTVATSKVFKALGAEGWHAGAKVADSFKPQWKHEQYSIIYYETQQWYDAMNKAEHYEWKGAMDIWMGLLDSSDVLKRASAAFNISVACYMLGDYHLASEWLDRSDEENKLPISDAMRKRINARLDY